MRVRVRGIYATALTARLLGAGFEVVQPSSPIRRRFDEALPAVEHAVRVETTADRQGVEVSGDPEAVRAVRTAIEDVGLDTFGWTAAAPRDAVFDATVERTVGGGAVVSLGAGGEAYLPFANAEEYIREGDALWVQVHGPAPPWSDDRPLVGTDICVTGGIATLVRGAPRVAGNAGDASEEFARLTDLLSTGVPDGWGVRWEAPAEDAEIATLDAALADAGDRAQSLDAALAGGPDVDDDPGERYAPGVTAHCWFGRASRFALDGERRTVTPTMVGHHRTKAATGRASDAVDLVERLCPPGSFPFAAVAAQFGPDEGDVVELQHGKPDGRLVSLGRGEVTARDLDAETVTVRRELTGNGVYDGLGVERVAGDTAHTTVREGRWWYPTTYRSSEGTVRGTYCNVCTPVELFPDAVRYVDLHVDVLRHADGAVEVVDVDELDAAVEAGHVSATLADRAREVAGRLARGLRSNDG